MEAIAKNEEVERCASSRRSSADWNSSGVRSYLDGC